MMRQLRQWWLVATVVLAVSLGGARAQDLFGDGDDGFSLEEPGSEVLDLDQLGASYATEIDTWEGVRPLRHDGESEHPWKAVAEPGYNHLKSFVGRERITVQPLRAEPLRSRVDVPEAGRYRLWLCYLAAVGPGQPMTLRIGDQALTYYQQGLSGNDTGASQEAERPIRFESEMTRIGMIRQPTFIWEYRDVELPAGRLPLSLQAEPGSVRVDTLLITRSRDFVPSKAVAIQANTLGRTYLRVRVLPDTDAEAVSFSNSLTYHDPHHIHGDVTRYWYWSIENELGLSAHFGDEEGQPVKPGTWSRWLDGSASLLSRGRFVTGFFTIKGARGPLVMEVQLAWYPHETAVTKTLQVPVVEGGSRGTALLPLYLPRVPLVVLNDEADVAWGMRDPAYLAQLRNALDVVAEQQAVLARADLPDAPPTQALRITTGANPDPVARPETAAMLRRMGFAHMGGAKPEELAAHGMRQEAFTHHNDLLFHAGTHCPSDPLARVNLQAHFDKTLARFEQAGWSAEQIVMAKLGDEIGAIVSTHHIDTCGDCRRRFHDYLAEHYEAPAFFGVEQWRDLRMGGSHDSLYGRRLAYASSRFHFDFTAEFYAMATEVIEAVMPNCRTYCNFSPHPVIFGGTMNHSDWFNLTWRGGTSLAWGEDWASMSSWGFYMGWQIVSYYASLVEAAARPVGGHGGFYAVGGTGRRQAACISRGLQTVVVYSYGPAYGLADDANAWSMRHHLYEPIAQGLHVLGGGDAYFAEGTREPAPVALYYNRDHELWHAEMGKYMQAERASLLVGLSQANIPTTVAIEEELLAGGHPEWQAVWLTGFNLGDDLVAALTDYVRGGGIVVASGGAGVYDRFDGVSQAAPKLLGVTPRLGDISAGGHAPNQLESHEPIGTMRFAAGGEWPVIGLRTALHPADDAELEILATFEDGSPALVRHSLGEGAVYTWAVSPGVIFRAISPMQDADGNRTYSMYTREDAARLALPVQAIGEARSHRYGHHLVETRQFDRPEGTAILLMNYAYQPLAPAELRIRWPAERPLGNVRSVHQGELQASRDGDWLRVELPLAHETDAVIVEEP